MPIDDTNEIALKQLQEKYGDQIYKFEYEVRKRPYLGKEPKGAFCSGMTRYRKHIKVTHVVLKDGSRIPVGGTGCLVVIFAIGLIPVGLLVFMI